MHVEVFVKFAGCDDIALRPTEPMALDAAVQWLDDQFLRLDATVSRPTGKVLLVDKVLAIAAAAGHEGFADAAWAETFACAAAGALRRPLIRVDVPDTSVGF